MNISDIQTQIDKKQDIIAKANKRVEQFEKKLTKDYEDLKSLCKTDSEADKSKIYEAIKRVEEEFKKKGESNLRKVHQAANEKIDEYYDEIRDLISEEDWENTGRFLRWDISDHMESYWKAYFRGLEAENKIQEHREKISALTNDENIYNNLPQIIKDFLNKWADNNVAYFIERHDNSKNDPFRGWCKSDIEKNIRRNIKLRGLEIAYRVREKAGNIVNADHLSIGCNGSINGFIEGDKGKCIVESITAGGYNIQRLHYRVLVK